MRVAVFTRSSLAEIGHRIQRKSDTTVPPSRGGGAATTKAGPERDRPSSDLYPRPDSNRRYRLERATC